MSAAGDGLSWRSAGGSRVPVVCDSPLVDLPIRVATLVVRSATAGSCGGKRGPAHRSRIDPRRPASTSTTRVAAFEEPGMSSMGSTAERGYGAEHQQLRARWAPVVKAGGARCHAVECVMPSRVIRPGAAWDLGHADDRSGWTGPEHRRCNRRAGAIKRNRLRAARRRRPQVELSVDLADL